MSKTNTKTNTKLLDAVAYICDKYTPIAEKHGPMTLTKLQELVYYSQVWSLVFDWEPLFGEPIEAWEDGPVVRKLRTLNRKQDKLSEALLHKGDPDNLDEEQQITLDFVVRNYGPMKPGELKKLTRRAPPWKKAWKKSRERMEETPAGRGNVRIRHEDMVDYYASLM